MRIALITREYPPETGWGGIATFYHRFAHALCEQGHDVEVFAQAVTSPRIEMDGPVMIHRFMPRRYLILKRCGGDLAGMDRHLGIFSTALAWEATRVFRKRHREAPFDLVEGQEHLGLNAFINVIPGRSFATVTRYHTAYHTFVRRELVDWPPSGIIRRLERWSLTSADMRISASRFIDDAVQEDFPGVPRADAVVPLLSPLDVSRNDDADREPLILFVGRFVPNHKRPHLAAEAFARVAADAPDWTMEFAGPDYPMNSEQTVWQVCEQLLAQAAPGRYTHHGSLPPEQVEALYRKASIIIIPSRFESFGLVALEALACGCVPIVSDNTAMAEAVGDAGVVFRNGDIDDLESKLRDLLASPHRLAERRAAGYEHVARVTDTASLMERNLALFEQVIEAKRGGA
ncbi:MAG: glycosyltransferase family 4 protein [Phycisphaerales bacterium]|nr:glycosyltransferase family 4 protein [Phycisphaerales bacterium]